MFKFLKDRKKKDNKGFTLVELVIVVAILAILVGILAPQYTKYVEKSRKAADASNLENLVTAFKTAASDGTDKIAAGSYKITINKSVTSGKTTTLIKDNATTTDADVAKLITSYAGTNWEDTKLKSAKWETATAGADGKKSTVDNISATLVVKNDGSVTVTYEPTDLKEQANQ